eukprot:5320088-Amphidinium_carterae.2
MSMSSAFILSVTNTSLPCSRRLLQLKVMTLRSKEGHLCIGKGDLARYGLPFAQVAMLFPSAPRN